jgi:hypothetical protein
MAGHVFTPPADDVTFFDGTAAAPPSVRVVNRR